MSLAMLTPVPPSSAHRRPAFITPLSRDDLFDLGEEFPREELRRRILSQCWRDCCWPLCFSRAPAPAIEISGHDSDPGGPTRLAAWWLLQDGIIGETEGPNSERLRPFCEGLGRNGQLWPRYEFRILPESRLAGETGPVVVVEVIVYQRPMVRRGYRTQHAVIDNDRLRVVAHEPLWEH